MTAWVLRNQGMVLGLAKQHGTIGMIFRVWLAWAIGRQARMERRAIRRQARTGAQEA